MGSEQMFLNILADMLIDASLYPVKKKIATSLCGEFFTPDIHTEINVDMIVKGCGICWEDVYRAELPAFEPDRAIMGCHAQACHAQ